MDEQLSAGALLTLALILSTMVEWIAERFLGPLLKGWQMVFATAALGVLLCFLFNVDALSLVGFEGDYYDWGGKIISGIIIGSGSNAIHKFLAPSVKK